jgi:hypothetical protein
MLPGGSELPELLPMLAVADRVMAPPWLTMPPLWPAMLPVTWL